MVRIVCLTGIALSVATLSAGEKLGNPTPPATDVAVVLRAESEWSGRSYDRRAALEDQRDDSRDSSAWWQSGFVKVGDDWRSYDDARPVDSELRQRYAVKRAAAKSTAADQLQLADWCREQRLADEERTHLIRALATGQAKEPAKILHRLGYRQVGPWWFTDEELQSYKSRMQAVRKERQRLQPKLDKLAEKLEGKLKQRQRGLEELRALATLAAIPVLEETLGRRSEPTASAVVTVFSEIDSYRASQALARMAITSDWTGVRDAATKELKRRPLEEFVPMVLEMMSLPISVEDSTADIHRRLRQGAYLKPEWRFVFVREGRKQMEVSMLRIFDAGVMPNARLPLPYLDRGQQTFDLENTARAAADVLHQRLEITDTLNALCELMNARAGELLSAVTGSSPSSEPLVWWRWWDRDMIDVDPGQKNVVIVSEETRQISTPVIPVAPLFQVGCSCLAAGTPVRTVDGFLPIEKIRVGDRVLAKNVETGELAYKPVLHTTRRQNAELSQLTVGDESFAASPGHNFWISGRGWTRTNQLETGMPAHTVTGAAAVAVEPTGRTEDVFNLVVADFHTYFVGKSMVLGHDVIQPSPTDAVVPGLENTAD